MNYIFLKILLLIALLPLEAMSEDLGSDPSILSDTINAAQGKFSVRIDREKKVVEVTREDDQSLPAPELRVRIFRKNDRPLDVRLHMLRPVDQPLRYDGRVEGWNGSMVGAQVDFSFDKKTWKKLGRALKSVLP